MDATKAHCALVASWFCLGMGLMSPSCAIIQTLDWHNTAFPAGQPSRVLILCYRVLTLSVLLLLYLSGERVWPSRRSRLLAGFCIYLAVLVLLPIVDAVLVDVLGQRMQLQRMLQAAFYVWAGSSSVLGAADALISTVAYGEAAATGPRFLHAFIAGKAVTGLVLFGLRAVTKLALPPTFSGLRHSVTLFLSIAALIVLVCVVVVAVVLPSLRATIEALQARPGLTVGQTLQAVQHARTLHRAATVQCLPQAAPGTPSSQRAARLERGRRLLRSASIRLRHCEPSLLQLIDAAVAAEAEAQRLSLASVHGPASLKAGSGFFDPVTPLPAPGGKAAPAASAEAGPDQPGGAPPHHVQLPHSRMSLRRFAANGLVRDGLSVVVSSWLALRLVAPCAAALSISGFTINFITPAVFSPLIGTWPAVGTFYTVILTGMYQLGTLIGSSTPIARPRYAHATLLACAVATLLTCVPAFALCTVFAAGPGGFIALTLVASACTSYFVAWAFMLAPHGLLPRDAHQVETLLVIVMTVAYGAGTLASMAWAPMLGRAAR